jgi:hypothetical protein
MDPWWRPLLLVGGATRENAYVDMDDDSLTLCLGLLFGQTIMRAQIESAAKRSWPLWMGIGWRSYLGRLFGLTGSTNGVVEIRLTTPLRVWRVLNCTCIAVSLEQPDEFLAALDVPT